MKPAAKAAPAKAPVKPAVQKAPPAKVAAPAVKPAAVKPVAPKVEEPKKPATQRQGFKTNEFVVYPAHGVGQILAIEEQEIAGAREKLGWHHPPFEIPEEIYGAWRGFGRRGAAAREEWSARPEAQEAATRAEFERGRTMTRDGLVAELARLAAEDPT